MSGTKTGGLRAAQTNRKRYGENFYSLIGTKGGSVTGIQKGFAKDRRSLLEKLMLRPKLAKLAGKKGEKISRRGKKGNS